MGRGNGDFSSWGEGWSRGGHKAESLLPPPGEVGRMHSTYQQVSRGNSDSSLTIYMYMYMYMYMYIEALLLVLSFVWYGG
jgi:hypothetical protein